MPFKFEKLLVYQKALDLSDYIFNLVKKKFPKDERYNLSSQIQRAADSVGLNIAEGSTGQSPKEFGRFLKIALRSDVEVAACINLAVRRKYVTKDDHTFIHAKCEEILVMINGLKNSVLKEVPAKKLKKKPSPNS